MIKNNNINNILICGAFSVFMSSQLACQTVGQPIAIAGVTTYTVGASSYLLSGGGTNRHDETSDAILMGTGLALVFVGVVIHHVIADEKKAQDVSVVTQQNKTKEKDAQASINRALQLAGRGGNF